MATAAVHRGIPGALGELRWRAKSICEMSLASGGLQWGRDVQREMDEWSEDQRRWDAKERGYRIEALTCRYGGDCRQGLNCPYWHSDEEIGIFVDERELRTRKLMIRCGFCARGECKFEGCCARPLRIAAAAEGPADSGYEANIADSEGGRALHSENLHSQVHTHA